MGSELLVHVGLLGTGFALGRVQCLQLVLQLFEELSELSPVRKVALASTLILLCTIYLLGMLMPLDAIARKEAQAVDKRFNAPTSFRRELRRRGSYSMSYVMDIKAHVFARS